MRWTGFIYRWGIRLILANWYLLEKITRGGAFRHYRMTPVGPVYTPCGNRAKDLLHAYHVKQFHESSCSVASVAAVLNALLEITGRQPPSPVTQQELLDTVREEHWKERMSDGGYNGKRGLPLDVLGRVVQAALTAYEIPGVEVDVVRADRMDPAGFRKRLEQRLIRFETQGSCFIIAHFDQGSFIPEYHIPHISPVGGYDAQNRYVTLLDVDPELHHPYRISFETFVKGMSFTYHNLFRPFGYACGGYVCIRFNRPAP